jgi:uncharacterized protein (DUF362 family)/Pyruvate/2-oxoacid:ferredoxin oxidoreductase delta subunit
MAVALSICEEYDYEKVKTAINEAMNQLGGLQQFIKPGDKVLLKVNLLMKRKPEDATTTHPVFVRAMTDLVMAEGGQVVIGDSPGGPFLSTRMRNIYKATGMEEVSELTGATLNNNLETFQVEAQNGKIIKHLQLTDMINDVDIIINLPKLKTHGFTVYTGAVKNLFGCVPGTIKAEYHVKMPDVNDFSNALIDICEQVKPVLHVMDGIVAMEGAGPSSGTPRSANFVLASTDPHQLDQTACRLIGLEEEEVPTLRCAMARQLVKKEANPLIVGDFRSFVIKDFKRASSTSGNYRKIPKPVRDFLVRTLKSTPVFDHDKCIGCGDCAYNCPPKAIEMVGVKPKLSKKECISCFCCQELCPVKAIEINKPMLSKIIFR